MRLLLLLSLFLFSIAGNSQNTIAEFPGRGFNIELPDTSFFESEGGFRSKEHNGTLVLLDEEQSMSKYGYDKVVKIFLKEISRPGTTILLDKYVLPDSSRILKVKIEYDITDRKPATKGRIGIGWFYFYKNAGTPLILMGSYDIEYDTKLNDLYFRSLQSLKRIASSAKDQ